MLYLRLIKGKFLEQFHECFHFLASIILRPSLFLHKSVHDPFYLQPKTTKNTPTLDTMTSLLTFGCTTPFSRIIVLEYIFR